MFESNKKNNHLSRSKNSKINKYEVLTKEKGDSLMHLHADPNSNHLMT